MKKERKSGDKSYLFAAALIVLILFFGIFLQGRMTESSYEDGIERVDPDTIYLKGSKTEVNFSEVLLSSHAETRKLVVSEQEATVTAELTARMIEPLDFDFMRKSQSVSYTGKGFFVVDLDTLTSDRIRQDTENKELRILIDHAYLRAIEIDPEKIFVGEVQESLLARGDITLTLRDYQSMEKELRDKLKAKFDTVENGQEADTIALRMVEAVYAPVVRAIDPNYRVVVQFYG